MPSHRHSFSGDELYRRVIEDEVDRLKPDLHPDHRRACIEQVSQLMDGEIEEHLVGADLFPELLTVRLREKVALVLGGESSMLAA